MRYVSRQQIRELRETEGYPADGGRAPARHLRRAAEDPRAARGLARSEPLHARRHQHDPQADGIGGGLHDRRGRAEAPEDRSVGGAEIANGTARVLRTPFKTTAAISREPMFARLQAAAARPPRRARRLSSEWLLVSDAALLAGVSATQIQRWADHRRGAVSVHDPPISPVPPPLGHGARAPLLDQGVPVQARDAAGVAARGDGRLMAWSQAGRSRFAIGVGFRLAP
jgi:hypothetical protein